MSEIAKIFGPEGSLWAVAPDDSWKLRSDPWPEVNQMVEVCWSSRFEEPPRYNYDCAYLVEKHIDGIHMLSTWKNENHQTLVFNPDFWRPIEE